MSSGGLAHQHDITTSTTPLGQNEANDIINASQGDGKHPCVLYRRGTCRYGERCKFSHNLNENKNALQGKRGKRNLKPNPSGKASSSANNGVNDQSSTPAQIEVPRRENQGVCWEWRRHGKCSRGDKGCRFSHDTIAAQPRGPDIVPRERLQSTRAPRPWKSQFAGQGVEEGLRQDSSQWEGEIQALLTQEADRKRVISERQEAERKVRQAAEEEARRAAEEARRAAEEAQRLAEAARRAAAERARLAAEERVRQEAERKARQAAEEALRIEREAAFTAQHQVLGSTLVTVGSGLDIRHVVSGFESCRLTIKNLPSDAKPHEIIELFTQQGIDRDTILIDRISTNGGHQEAIILTSRAQGGPVAVGLDGIKFRNETLHFEFGENISAEAMGQSSSHDANVLTITWRAPSTTMIAIYHDMELAREKARTLNNTVFDGRRVKVEMNRPPTGPALKYYTPESIKIIGLPPDILPHQVAEFAGTVSIRPLKSMAYNFQELLLALRRRLDRICGLQSFEQTQQLDGNVTVKARFETWEQAQSARDSLDGIRLEPDYPLFRLFIPKPLQYVVSFPPEQYHAQKRNWDSLAGNGSKASQVRIQENRHAKRVFVRVIGEEKKAVGALKVRVETMVSGERLDATFWHRSFSFPKGREFLAKVYTDAGVYLRCDWKIQALRMYGDDDRKERARQMVADEVSRLARLEWTIPVKRQAVGYLVRKGLAALKERLGDDAVTLDLASRPCKLTLRGGEEARHAIDVVFEQAMNDMDFAGPGADGDDVCPICYDEVSHPVKLGCKHVYCTPCIRHYLTSAADTKVFPLTCMGDEAKCKVPIPIPVIQRFLRPQQYKHLVDVVFSAYLDRHPQQFRYCTTPDCTQIYRCNVDGMLKCPSCFAEVCPSCHEEAHEGMTCEERNRRKTQEEEALNNNWATMNGVKKCPSCQVWIEKTEGCNHMTCRCGAHVCWRCMGVFPRDEIYRHLADTHGGAFDEDGQHQNADLQYAAQLQRQYELQQEQPRVQPPLDDGFQARWMAHQQAAAAHRERAVRERAAREQADRVAREQADRAAREQAAREQAERQRTLERLRAEQVVWEREYRRQVAERQPRRREDSGWGCIVM